MRARIIHSQWFGPTKILLVIGFITAVFLYADEIWDRLAGAPRGNELLICAAGGRSVAEVDRALAQGADINTRTMADLTPLFHACDNGSEVMVKAMLDRGADPSAVAQTSLRPLHTAVVSGNARVVELLLAAGADPNVTINGITVLDYAERYESPEVIAALRSHGAKHAVELVAIVRACD